MRNADRHLEFLVPALAAQTMERNDFEVILADDGSDVLPTDLETADEWLRVVPGHGPDTESFNSYAARNRGVLAARGEVIAFIDADCVPKPTWLEEGVRALDLSDLVAGHVSFQEPAKRTVWAFIDMETSKNQELNVRLGVAETANLFVSRAVFDALGGFADDSPAHGDFDFAERAIAAGFRLGYAVQPSVSHPVRWSRSVLLRAHWDYTAAYAERVASRGERPYALRLRSWCPLVPVIRQRRRIGISLDGPDREWLAANGVALTRLERLKSLPLIYLVIPYWRQFAQVHGWIRGRRRASARATADGLTTR